MKLYHGSKAIVDEPRAKGSNPANDYGPAFYLTEDLESAKEWACRNNSVGFVNVYSLNESNLRILDLRDKKYSPLNWLAILMHYRSIEPSFKLYFKNELKFLEEEYFIDVEQFDVVIGYRADDAYFRFPLDFIRGNITVEQLEGVYKAGKLGYQVVIISQKAIEQLTFVKYIEAEEKYIDNYFTLVQMATKKYDELDRYSNGTRIRELMGNKK